MSVFDLFGLVLSAAESVVKRCCYMCWILIALCCWWPSPALQSRSPAGVYRSCSTFVSTSTSFSYTWQHMTISVSTAYSKYVPRQH